MTIPVFNQFYNRYMLFSLPITIVDTKIVGELPEMRQDTVELVKKAMGEKRQAYVLVNNRSEGNAPLTIQALRNALQGMEK